MGEGQAGWQIRRIDNRDEAAVRRHWEIERAANAHRPLDLVWTWEAAWAAHSGDRDDIELHLLGAFGPDDTMTGAAQLQLPLADNTHVGYAEVFTDPARARQGVGRALLAEVERRAAAAGRRSVVVEAYVPPTGPAAALGFAAATGYAPAIEEEVKSLDVAASEPRWGELEAEAAPHHSAYRLVAWRDHVPDDLVDGYCRLNDAFNEEAPTGELDIEAESWTAARVRQREDRFIRGGRVQLGVLAVAPDGTVAAMTEMVVTASAPATAMQGGTLVVPAHRGRRLGMGVKVANLRALRSAFPTCAQVVTGNADVNAAMNAVNDRLGFRVVERCLEMQKRLA
jgi:GNAT superfamily N-acetyltransferase